MNVRKLARRRLSDTRRSGIFDRPYLLPESPAGELVQTTDSSAQRNNPVANLRWLRDPPPTGTPPAQCLIGQTLAAISGVGRSRSISTLGESRSGVFSVRFAVPPRMRLRRACRAPSKAVHLARRGGRRAAPRPRVSLFFLRFADPRACRNRFHDAAQT